MYSPEKQAQIDAVTKFARRCTIGILASRPGGTEHALQGSGVLYRARGSSFLVTATHVVDGQDTGEIEFGLAVGGEVGGGEHLSRVSFPSHTVDVAVFKFSPKFAAAVERAGFAFIDGDVDIDRPHDQYDGCMILGYSSALTKVTETIVDPMSITIHTKLYDGPIEGVASSAEPKEWDVLFHWPKEQGVPAHAPGISGGGVWGIRYSSDGFWTAERNMRPIAIETAIVPKGAPRWIRATRWELVKMLIDDKGEDTPTDDNQQ